MRSSDRAVDIWLACPERISQPRLLSAYRNLLDDDERRTHDRFHFAEHRHTYLVSHALLRTGLSHYADVRPDAWRFVRNRYGRPAIAAGLCAAPLRFSLSHTRGLVALAVTLGRDVGVDVEDTERGGPTLSVADRFFSASEVRALCALAPADRRQRFFHYWTLKESYIKARGMGVSLPLDGFSFHLDGGGPIRISVAPSLADDPRLWQFASMRPTAQHTLAVAVRRGAGADLALRVATVVPQPVGEPRSAHLRSQVPAAHELLRIVDGVV